MWKKGVKQNILFDHRNWNILAFRGRLMSLLVLRSAGSHRGLSSHRSLAYSSCWGGFSFTKSCFTILIHPSQIHSTLFIIQNIRCTSVYYSLIRSTAALIGTKGGDSWDCA